MKIPNPTADREKDPGDTQNILQVDSEKDPSRFSLNLSETNYQIASRQNPNSVRSPLTGYTDYNQTASPQKPNIRKTASPQKTKMKQRSGKMEKAFRQNENSVQAKCLFIKHHVKCSIICNINTGLIWVYLNN
jgi:hypothetical protein